MKPSKVLMTGVAASLILAGGVAYAADVTSERLLNAGIAKASRQFPNYAGVLATPGLVWSGELDGTFGAFDGKTLDEKWSMNLGTPFAAPAITFTMNGKQYVAIAGGAPSIMGDVGHPELSNIQAANMLYVFSL